MRFALSRAFVVALSGILLIGCAPAAVAPTPTPAQVARWQVTPAAAFVTPLPPTSTRTPTPQLPTRIPSPTPSPSATPKFNEALALLRQVDSQRQEVTSSRALIEMLIEGQDDGEPVSATMTIESEFNDVDARLKMSLVGGDLPVPFDMEFITVGDTAYMRMGEEWTAFPGGKSSVKSETNLLDTEDMEEFLSRASDAQIVGRRTVKGVECDVISISLSAQDMLELAAKGGGGVGGAPSDDVALDSFESEVAIGVADRVVRQMVFKMSGAAKDVPADRFSLVMTMTVWDINSPDVVIKPPANVKPFASPTPARAATPRLPTRTPVPSGRSQMFAIPTPQIWSFTPVVLPTFTLPTVLPTLRR